MRSPITPIAHIAHPVLVASESIVDQVDTVSHATVPTTAPIHPATAPTHSHTTPAALPDVVLGGVLTGAVETPVGVTGGAACIAAIRAI